MSVVRVGDSLISDNKTKRQLYSENHKLEMDLSAERLIVEKQRKYIKKMEGEVESAKKMSKAAIDERNNVAKLYNDLRDSYKCALFKIFNSNIDKVDAS
jgi:DNA-binding phage protein